MLTENAVYWIDANGQIWRGDGHDCTEYPNPAANPPPDGQKCPNFHP